MHLRKKHNKFLIWLVLFMLLLNYFPLEFAQAESLENAKDTISTSRPSTAAKHVVEFTTSADIGVDGYFEITLPDSFGDLASGTCSGPNVAISTTTETLRCTYSVSPGAATTTKILINDVINPAVTGSHAIYIRTYNSVATELEESSVAISINDEVAFHAHIYEELLFTMADEDVSEVNGVKVTGSSTPTTLPFDNLAANSSSTLAHTLRVDTNANFGFTMTVQQDQDMRNDNNDTINSFDNSPDNTGSTTPHTWNPPTAQIGQDHTYGHIGLTSDDDSLSSLDFSGSKYSGFNGTEIIEIMYHNGKADGQTPGIGLAHVAYTIEVSALQEAGVYTNSLTYICTPTY